MLLNTTVDYVEGLSGEQIHVHVNTATASASSPAPIFSSLPAAFPTRNPSAWISRECRPRPAWLIKVNERLETTAPNVWALGDCAGSPLFTHVALDDFRVVRDNLHGGNRTTSVRLVPYVVFTDPEVARVGLNETEAKTRGSNIAW